MDELELTGIHVDVADLAVIGVYIVAILIAGFYVTRLASRNIDSYFLGGRQLPWWLLGLSGTASYFDVAGVMWTIAFFYILGQRFMWAQWQWGFLAMAFFAGYMGKWLRRSNVVTGAEWMVVRFGKGPAGEFARSSYAVLAVVIAVSFIGFAEYGCGRFLTKFIPADRGFGQWLTEFGPDIALQHKLAIILMTITGLYAMASGLFGVALTNFIQFCIILFGSGVLIVKAVEMSSYEKVAAEVPPEWFGFAPMWQWEHVTKWGDITGGFELFLLVTIALVAKGVFLSIGGPQQLYDMQRFLSARTPREASKAGMVWGVAMTPMFMVSAAVAVIGLVKWGGNLAHPEDLYPVVIGTLLPVGIKGLVLAGLLSAFMSTFASTVNAGASYLVRDGYQHLLRPNAGSRELIRASRVCSGLVIVAGIAVGMLASNINVIFEWIMMTLGTAVLMPNVLRWFWWRFNGTGFAVGTLAGVVAAVAEALVKEIWGIKFPLYVSFPILFGISSATSIVASLLTPATDMETLKDFYCRIRPAGAWGPVKRQVLTTDEDLPKDTFGMDILTAVIGGVGLQALFLTSTYAVTHQWRAFNWALIVAAGSACMLYFTWYKYLPDPNERLAAEATQTQGES